MLLPIDPAYPLVWRSPHAVQFGVEQPALVLAVGAADDPSPPPETTARELVLEQLAHAGSVGALHLAADQRGIPTAAADAALVELAHELRPVFRPGAEAGSEAGSEACDAGQAVALGRPLSGRRIAVDGGGAPAGELLRLLGALGAETRGLCTRADGSVLTEDAAAPGSGRRRPSPFTPEVVVVLAHYAVPPRRVSGWLRDDVPHLLVEFGDRSVRVGPLVLPGQGPCAVCLELHRRDADAAWPAIAAQLLGRRAPTADALGAVTAAAFAARVLVQAFSGRADGTAPAAGWGERALRISRPELVAVAEVLEGAEMVEGTGVRLESVNAHPSCGCRSLPENAMARDPSRVGARPPPRRAAVGCGRG